MTNTELWSGEFGDEYTSRNTPIKHNIDARRRLFADIFSHMGVHRPATILEVGAGGGGNLMAIRGLLESVRLIALEPNRMARAQIYESCVTAAIDIVDGEARKMPFRDGSAELVFTCGVLIHIPPDQLGEALDEIYRVSSRYIVCAEYFSPETRSLLYRGREGVLWTSDFGSAYLDRFPDLHSCAYGFTWKRDTGLDNLTWHLLEKTPC